MKHARSPYSQQPMSQAEVRSHAAKHRRSSTAKRVGLIIGGVVLALLLIAGGFYLWFILSLNHSLSLNADDKALEALAGQKAGEPFYTLVLASDSRDGGSGSETGEGERTDVMMLARIDAKDKRVTLLSIPRDTRYTLEDGRVVKMNELCNIGGAKKAIEGVSKLTGLPISHYAMVRMSDLKQVVDELGGVEVNVPLEINNTDPETGENVNIQPGQQVLNGQQAQNFAISRHESDSNQDAYRQGKIRDLLSAIINKVIGSSPLAIPGMVVNLAKYVQTDMRADNIIGLATDFATNRGKFKLYQASGPSEGGIDEATGMWLCYENPEGWKQVVEAMDSGKDPSKVKY